MSLFGSMTTAISGLTAQSRSLGHISDNIANSQTIGFKRTDTSFVDLLTTSNPRLHSPGSVVARPDFQNSVQGTIEQVENRTALAVAGQGFFPVTVQNGEENNQPTFDARQFYTRAGDFKLDRNGYMVNSAGYFLKGWASDPGTGSPDRTDLVPIRVSQLVSNPVATSEIQFAANLPADFAANSNFTSTREIYDSLGNQHSIQFNWNKVANNSWRLDIAAPGSTLDPVGGGSPIPGFNDQTINTFNVQGTVQPVRQEDVVAVGAVTPGTTYTLTVNGTPLSYTAVPTDTQTSVRNQLISQVNTLSSTLGVSAQVESGTELRLRANVVGTPYSAGTGASLSLTNDVANVAPQPQTDSFIMTGTVGEIGDDFTISLSGITGGSPATRSWTYSTTGSESSINAVANGLAAIINADPDSPSVATVSGGIVTLTAKSLNPIPTWTVDTPTATNGTIPPHLGVTFGATPATSGTPVAFSMANVGGGSATVPANQQSGDPAWIDIVADYGQGQQTMRIHLGTFGQADGLTQFGGTEYAVRTLSQNGVPQGSFSSLAIRETGDVVVNYDNGQSRVINRVPVVTFNAPDALERVDGQAFQRTIDSGEARALDPQSDGAGKLVVSSIERSNVDIASEFTKLITAQRAYTANTRVVSASDEMLRDTLNMSR
ncbi:MAG: flagellar hook-basal body complex protein [Acetobacteraceae bacterium]|nr:flagellar hook-basal body complex protein [Acetobacteraceae bacterium]